MNVTPEIKHIGYGLSGDIGGLPKQTYYTPDGRVIKAIPCMREFVRKDKDGNVIEGGTRDANYDKGWLPVMPTELKLYCRGCDKWHDTQEEVDECTKRQQKLVNKLSAKARKQYAEEEKSKDLEIEELNKKIEALSKQMEAMVNEIRKN
jgi:ribosomal protein L44E